MLERYSLFTTTVESCTCGSTHQVFGAAAGELPSFDKNWVLVTLYNPQPLNRRPGFSVVHAVVRGESRSHKQQTSLLRGTQLLLDTVYDCDVFDLERRRGR